MVTGPHEHEWRFPEQYGGIRTRKLLFLFKISHQKSRLEVDVEFGPMLVTRELILYLLSGKVSGPEEVKSQLESP